MLAAICCSKVDAPRRRAANPNVLLDATDSVHGIGGYINTRLLVRLTDDGRVEWDKWVNNGEQRNASWISLAEVTSIERRLETVDETKITSKMGPYNIYVDTSVELSIRMATRTGLISFSVIDPWSSNLPRDALGKGRIPPMPSDVESVVCEIDVLHGQISGDPIDRMCKAKDATPN